MTRRLADPIIAWPRIAGSLQASIAELQRLNPRLGLRCAVSTRIIDLSVYPPHYRKELEESGPPEYLIHDGTALDVVTIVMPGPPTDNSMSGFTEINREGGTHKTDLGEFRYCPRRIERGAEGGLLIRPRSDVVAALIGRFSRLFQGGARDRSRGEQQQADQIIRFQSQWGIYRDPNELWEVDFAYHAPDYLYKTDDDKEYWRTTPIGTISYIDRYDLPLEEHLTRAQVIVAAGSQFAVVVNVEAAEGSVFRASGAERFTEAFRLPEWHWFDIPVRIERGAK